MSVVAPVRAAFSALPERPTLVLCGISLDTRILSLFDDVATIKVLPPTDDYQEFLNVMQSQKWDLGLAPLAAGRFEAAKSDIKLLDYAAFGIPGLYADHPAYATVQNNVTGMVAAADNWADCILRIARDPAFAAKIVAESRAYVFSQRTLDRTVPGLATILEQLASEPQ
jgi:glycosyltransferase involved in cell wall biosynthesis